MCDKEAGEAICQGLNWRARSCSRTLNGETLRQALTQGYSDPDPTGQWILGPPVRPTNIISSPPHYRLSNGQQALEVIEAAGLPNHLSTALAYLLRCQRKGSYQDDLKKCAFYVLRQLALDGVDVVEFTDKLLEDWPPIPKRNP